MVMFRTHNPMLAHPQTFLPMRMFFLLEWDNDPTSLEGSKQTPVCLSKLSPLETQISDFLDSCEKEHVQP